jgi:hypothetical protein
MFDPIRGSIWMSNVNTVLGTMLLASCALGASLLIIHSAYGVNPVAQAFAAVTSQETELGD